MIIFEIIKLIIYILLIVFVSKQIMMKSIKNIAIGLNLKSKTIGQIEGLTTSIPELFTVSLSSIAGLPEASVVNILSSNFINITQYAFTIILNKNAKILKNKALIIDILLAIITIIIPFYIIKNNINFGISFSILFIILFFFFLKINSNAHSLYLKEYEERIENKKHKEIKEEKKWKSKKKKVIIKNIIYLIVSIAILFLVGDKLNTNLSSLCNRFSMPQYIVGFILGIGTSIPELITFIEAQRNKRLEKNKNLGVIEATNSLLSSNMLNLFIIQSIGVILFEISVSF